MNTNRIVAEYNERIADQPSRMRFVLESREKVRKTR